MHNSKYFISILELQKCRLAYESREKLSRQPKFLSLYSSHKHLKNKLYNSHYHLHTSCSKQNTIQKSAPLTLYNDWQKYGKHQVKRWNVRYFYLYNSIQSSVVSISLIRHITNTSNIVHPPLDNSLNITFWASWHEKCQMSRRNV